MPRGLTARSFLRIYSVADLLVSAALKHTDTPPILLKSLSQTHMTSAGAHICYQAPPRQGGRVPEDRVGASGSEQALPGIPFSVAEAAQRTEWARGPGPSMVPVMPRRGTLPQGRPVGSLPTRENWGSDQTQSLTLLPYIDLHGHTLSSEHYLISKLHWPAPGPSDGNSPFYSSRLHKIIE